MAGRRDVRLAGGSVPCLSWVGLWAGGGVIGEPTHVFSQAGRTGPPPRGSEGKSQVRCRQGEKGWRGMLLGEKVSAVSAALGAAVVDAGLDELRDCE